MPELRDDAHLPPSTPLLVGWVSDAPFALHAVEGGSETPPFFIHSTADDCR